MLDLSITIPFYNEEPNVKRVLGEITDILSVNSVQFEIIAVDNGSSDRTGEIIKEMSVNRTQIKLLRVEINEGYGNGILAGLRASSGRLIGYMDGDGQIDVEAVLGCYKELQISDRFDLAKGFPRGIPGSFLRRYISKLYNAFITSIFRIETLGINCKPKIFKRELYAKLDLESKDWFIDAEIMIKATRLNVRYIDYPIQFKERLEGKSNVSIKTAFEFLFNFARYILFK
jgi:glycosyltransferase involved in cell wall biosynthesis